MAQDLSTYLDLVRARNPADVVSVSKPMDPAFEISATVAKLQSEAKRRPVLTFENVAGTDFPVLTNLHASRARLALAMNAEPRQMLGKYLDAMEAPLPPREVNTGPCKDVILTGDAVDLGRLPQVVHHQGDAGAYVTAAISFAKDPDGEMWNCAYNRLMITGKDETSIHLTVGKHLWEYYKVAEARDEALPVVFAIGVHPAIALGCLAIGSIDEDERGIMGALLGEPLELVRCETIDLLAPAHAEIILEAEILPGARMEEGPFGEFTGYSLGARQREVVKVKAITHREGAVYQDISVGHLDHMLLSTIPMEANLYRAVRAMVPSVRQVRVPNPFTCFVAIEQRVLGQATNAILAVLGSDLYMKRVVVVDQDVDVFDDREVNWAIATRCQPDRDITVISNARGSDLDPSTAGSDGFTAKWGVDATAKPSLAEYTPRHGFPSEVWEGIDLDAILPS
ncbi:MAG: UbiD family decarboxylase [Alphaproteobacteria bacterium]|jgi:UbiD family decarboxylase|nr:UbiD family decarboxylase [Alphaproteobacteria bacterium]